MEDRDRAEYGWICIERDGNGSMGILVLSNNGKAAGNVGKSKSASEGRHLQGQLGNQF